jgi:hypothetical protein
MFEMAQQYQLFLIRLSEALETIGFELGGVLSELVTKQMQKSCKMFLNSHL